MVEIVVLDLKIGILGCSRRKEYYSDFLGQKIFFASGRF